MTDASKSLFQDELSRVNQSATVVFHLIDEFCARSKLFSASILVCLWRLHLRYLFERVSQKGVFSLILFFGMSAFARRNNNQTSDHRCSERARLRCHNSATLHPWRHLSFGAAIHHSGQDRQRQARELIGNLVKSRGLPCEIWPSHRRRPSRPKRHCRH